MDNVIVINNNSLTILDAIQNGIPNFEQYENIKKTSFFLLRAEHFSIWGMIPLGFTFKGFTVVIKWVFRKKING